MTESVIVVGAGPVGLSFAVAAARDASLHVHLIERGVPEETVTQKEFDHRVYAVSPGSKDFLETLGVWQMMPRERIVPVTSMQVWGDDGKSETNFARRSPIAFIVENNLLTAMLWKKVRETACVEIHAPCKATELSIDRVQRRVSLTLQDGARLDAPLIVGADGANSWIRGHAGFSSRAKSYESFAVVANFECERPHNGIARQWFNADSVLAWLPLPGKRISIVWSVSVDESEDLARQSSDVLADRVRAAGRDSLGELRGVSPVARFPLRRIFAENWVTDGVALVGDAAHAIHPLAGQGLNLGFADARMLSDLLTIRSPLTSIGDLALLRKYERGRKESAMALATLTDQLNALFSHPSTRVAGLRNAGLRLVDRQSWLKRQLMQYAMR